MAPLSTKEKRFKAAIRRHYRAHGRHDLAWRKTGDPYAILVSEVMLQQTQVARVEGYYAKWLARFPDFASLAQARTGDVLAAWQGLGYNRRALALRKLAEIVVKEHGGRLPKDRAMLEALPGIGKGTSGSLMAFVFDRPEIFIETNVRRVFIHFFFKGTRRKVTDAALERYIQSTMDRAHPREWYWALMDFGAAMPAARRGAANPNRKSAHYRKQAAFKGSDRELRGKIVRYLLSAGKGMARGALSGAVSAGRSGSFDRVVSRLGQEGFIIEKRGLIYINNR